MKAPRENAIELLAKASHDLIAGEATIATGLALDTVCFHAQQAAEKSLKALLALRDVVYPWSHDLATLMSLARPLFPSVAAMEGDLLSLAPYAVEARYNADVDPTLDEARAALASAQKVYALAEKIIQTDTPPAPAARRN
jgi:HEPN domain-containing protein